MAKKSKRSKGDDDKCPPKFKVGDRVVFHRPNREVEGIVVEDRGTLGLDGERIYGLHFEFLPGEMRYTERDEGELTLLGTPMGCDQEIPKAMSTSPTVKKNKRSKRDAGEPAP